MRDSNLISPIIIAIGLVVAAISFALVGAILNTADGTTSLRLEKLERQTSELQRKLERMQAAETERARTIERILEDFARLNAAGRVETASTGLDIQLLEWSGDHDGDDGITEVLRLSKAQFNQGVTQPGNAVMLELLGRPRGDLDQECRGITEPRITRLLETREVGPIRVRMIRPALDSLERIMAALQSREPDLYAKIGTAGTICARLIRGSKTGISNHSWGTAIDIKLADTLDAFADGGTQAGLILLADLFNKEGWYWGAGYRREDSMHFEVGVETLRAWAAAGEL